MTHMTFCLTILGRTMVANLEQNPVKRPITSCWLPALLKGGMMWLIRGEGRADDNDLPEERYLLGSETWCFFLSGVSCQSVVSCIPKKPPDVIWPVINLQGALALYVCSAMANSRLS